MNTNSAHTEPTVGLSLNHALEGWVFDPASVFVGDVDASPKTHQVPLRPLHINGFGREVPVAAHLPTHDRHVEALGEEMVRQIENYWPTDIPHAEFLVIEEFVKEIVAETANPHLKDPISHVYAVASFVHWGHNIHGNPLDRRGLFTVAMILAFTERGLKGRPDAYVATMRSRLLGVAAQVNPTAVRPMPTKQRRAVNNPPYEDYDLDRFETVCRGLGRTYRRRNCSLHLGMSAGAGLNATDFVLLKNKHIVIDPNGPDSGVVVDIPEGHGKARTSLRGRQVAMLPRWEPLIRELITPDLDPDDYAVWPDVKATRINLGALTSGLKRSIENPNNRPVTSRLRTTWIVHHLRVGTPVVVLTDAAGTNSAESFFRYMPYVELPDWETRRVLLRGLQDGDVR